MVVQKRVMMDSTCAITVTFNVIQIIVVRSVYVKTVKIWERPRPVRMGYNLYRKRLTLRCFFENLKRHLAAKIWPKFDP